MEKIIDHRKKYGKTAPAFEEAIALLSHSADPVGKLISSGAYWIPLQFVYVQMVKNKDLVRISELTTDRKEYYWQMVKYYDWPQWKKVTLMQAIYVYENITQ